MLLKMENVAFTATKVLFFLEDVDIKNKLLSKKMSSGEKNYRYFTLLVTCMMIIKLSHHT